ncbi:DUF2750 domain-containing protein [Aliagarivorans marinus]|uniref:DUF2750 domain-containing protein n=1 Tax=Aliagarivorans marinus TaxID=561965 RepID=UPI000422D0E0|nr:DUF2750 domain-containing protein [Aliagarivorans marinus]
MSAALSAERIQQILEFDNDQRLRYLVKQVVEHQEVWILCDEHGSVMLNSEDEDCVPVWPNREFAESWCDEEWQDCHPKAIPLKQWMSRWIPGLEEDQLAVAVFPSDQEDGVVLYPEELEYELRQQQKKMR